MALIDLRSDTLTLPTPEMLQSMVTAKLGDDSRDGDPTVRELEAESARLMGKEAAVFTVSGTMSNTLALRTHATRGRQLLSRRARTCTAWNGAASPRRADCWSCLLVGTTARPIRIASGGRGRRPRTMYPARGVLCLENTHNAAGGTVMTAAQIAIAGLRRPRMRAGGASGWRAYLQRGGGAGRRGARDRVARWIASVSVCRRGFRAPVGSVLVGSNAFIERAGKVRRSFGAAMRQAGVIAAPGLVALRSMIGRLAEDHDNAGRSPKRWRSVPGLHVDLHAVQSNIVNVDVKALGIDAATFAIHLREKGVRGLPGMGSVVRFVTYRGISRPDIENAIEAVRTTVAARPWTAPAG